MMNTDGILENRYHQNSSALMALTEGLVIIQ